MAPYYCWLLSTDRRAPSNGKGLLDVVLVTGGAGFIGSNIVRALVGRGMSVRVLDDLSSGFSVNLEPFSDVEFWRGSVTDPQIVVAATEGCDTVFHLAASVGNKRSIDNPILDSQINVIGTLNVLEAARHAGVEKIVVSSSAGVFGELKQLPIDEHHPIDPDTPYGASKLAAEKLALVYAKLYDLDAVALRYFNVYGPNQRFDQYGNVIPIFVFRMLGGEQVTVFGDGDQTRDFVNVADVVRANIGAALTSGLSGVFNIASGTRITINDLAAQVASLVGGEPEIIHGPPRPGDVRDSLADISAAGEAFGYGPQVSLDDGLSEYVAWARWESGRV